MSTWSTVFPDLDEPVRGAVAAYDTAAQRVATIERSTAVVEREFARMTSSAGLEELQGATAVALSHLVDEVDSFLREVPPVFGGLDGVFRRHAAQLAALRAAADQALARATTRWNDVRRSDAAVDAAQSALSAIDRQIQGLQGIAAVDVSAQAQLDGLEQARWRATSDVATLRRAADDAVHWLDESRREYGRLVEREVELIEETIRAIGGVDLADLTDPNRLVQFAQDLGGALWNLGEEFLDAVVALAEGLAALAEMAMTEALRNLALAIKGALLIVTALAVGVLTTLSAKFPPPETSGDRGGTYEVNPRDDYSVDGFGGGERGRQAVAELLRHTADDDRIEADEFEIIELENGKWIVVLPGVTDLSRPHFGYSPHHQSVRDTDQAAVGSSTSTSIEGNLYAQMVAEAMRRRGVPADADVMLLGHSFGADTAVDLAADPTFGFNVTHVVAAAYHSGPQLSSVPDGTNVLVLQNHRDVPVIVERGGHGPIGALDSFNDGLDAFIDRDPGAGFGHLADAGGSAAGSEGFGLLTPGVTRPGPGQVHVVFEGGGAGAGHHQDNYVEYVQTATDPAVTTFFESLAANGYDAGGASVAVDVSVPR